MLCVATLALALGIPAVNAVITVPQVFSDGSTRRSAPAWLLKLCSGCMRSLTAACRLDVTCVVVLQTNRAYGGRPFMYGTAEPGETVTITGLDRRSAPGVPYPTLADDNGEWRVQLDPYQGPAVFNATITGSVSTNVVKIQDVVYGDVILCSGTCIKVSPLRFRHSLTRCCVAQANPT
jgi:hypothetical protein